MNCGDRQTVDLRKLYARPPALCATVLIWSWNFRLVSTRTPRSGEELTDGIELPFNVYDGGTTLAQDLEKRRTAHLFTFMWRPHDEAVEHNVSMSL